jgi:hypothetical protein
MNRCVGLFAVVTSSLLAAGCPGDDSSGDDAAGSSTGAVGTDSTGTPDPTSGSNPTTSVDSSSGGPPATSTSMGSDSGSDSGTDTSDIDCTAIAPGPLAAMEVFAPGAVFNGSEDLVFDGAGGLAGKNGGNVVLVGPDGTMLDSWADPGSAYGLRYRANGQLLAAHYMTSEIIDVISGDTVANGVGGVNGLWADFEGRVWFTNFSTVQRLETDDSVTPIVTGADASSCNGVIYDPDRSLLYYTNYGAGLIRAVEIMGDGSPGAVGMVASVPGAALDGLNLDACGNIYAIDQGNSRMYRVFTDEFGGPIGEPEVLIDSFPANVANAVWGSGDGWDPYSLYAAGVPGGVYRVQIGVPGAAAVTP